SVEQIVHIHPHGIDLKPTLVDRTKDVVGRIAAERLVAEIEMQIFDPRRPVASEAPFDATASRPPRTGLGTARIIHGIGLLFVSTMRLIFSNSASGFSMSRTLTPLAEILPKPIAPKPNAPNAFGPGGEPVATVAR